MTTADTPSENVGRPQGGKTGGFFFLEESNFFKKKGSAETVRGFVGRGQIIDWTSIPVGGPDPPRTRVPCAFCEKSLRSGGRCDPPEFVRLLVRLLALNLVTVK
jgi:hypothetical protein